ncbi:MAG: hypothetical protein HYX46_07600 [Betaproteobacteria bacterium]|nr:hypothetical protein [Betaproteobacteria bacterium]
MSVRLHIDRLVVEGVDLGPGGGALLRSSVEAELTRLVSDGGLGSGFSGGAAPCLSAGAIPHESNPARLGAHVARAVYDSLRSR